MADSLVYWLIPLDINTIFRYRRWSAIDQSKFWVEKEKVRLIWVSIVYFTITFGSIYFYYYTYANRLIEGDNDQDLNLFRSFFFGMSLSSFCFMLFIMEILYFS